MFHDSDNYQRKIAEKEKAAYLKMLSGKGLTFIDQNDTPEVVRAKFNWFMHMIDKLGL